MSYGGGNSAAGQARDLEMQRQARIKQGLEEIDKNYAKFGDDFYAKRSGDYENFALPQLGEQYQDTSNNLAYSLARSGMLKSGTAVFKQGKLAKELAQQKRNVADAGQASAQALRRDVEGNRSQLVAQLEASADPAASANLAVRSAAAFDQPQTFQPIGNFFENWSRTYLANQNARAYDPSVQPLFAWGSPNGSSRVVN